MSHLQLATHHLLAEAQDGGGGFSTNNLTAFLQHNVVTVLMVLLGIMLLLAAHKAAISKAIVTVGLGLLALFWFGMASTGNTTSASKFLVGLVFHAS